MRRVFGPFERTNTIANRCIHHSRFHRWHYVIIIIIAAPKTPTILAA